MGYTSRPLMESFSILARALNVNRLDPEEPCGVDEWHADAGASGDHRVWTEACEDAEGQEAVAYQVAELTVRRAVRVDNQLAGQ